MSPKNTLLATGLTALGLVGFAPPEVANPPGSALPGLPASEAPSPPYTVLLLSDGRLQEGTITEDSTNYVVHTPFGTIPVPKRLVEKAFRSIDEAYQYKAASVPQRDPDERMKLVRWCLTKNLTTRAKEQLQILVTVSPSYREARTMLDRMEKDEAHATIPRLDPAVKQAGVDVVERPEKIDPGLLLRAQHDLGIKNLPQIPGLPPTVAVKRAQTFNQYVNPVLQKRCAHCHNEGYPGSFQLIEIKPGRVRNPEVLRANLDATLRLIDTQNPDQSNLLSSALVPHGPGTNKKPIFRGANDPEYQVLSAWVNSLRPPKAPGEVASSRFETRPDGVETFAADRGTPPPLPFTPTPPLTGTRPDLPEPVNPVIPKPPGRIIPGSDSSAQPYAPPDADFPAPYMVGGPKPRIDPAPSAIPMPNRPTAPPPATLPEVDDTDNEPPLPRKPTKPVTLDPTLLQRALMQRNAPR
jgi:hypothetical protein